jgi:hypothetical protein
MQTVVAMVSMFLPDWMFSIFKIGVGLIFPIAVGAFALLDVGHLISEAMNNAAELKERAVLVGASEDGSKGFEKEIRRAAKQAQAKYKDIADAHMERMVQAVRSGDYSFGLRELKTQTKPMSQTSVSRVAPTPPQALSSPAPYTVPSLPAGPSSGNTIQLPLAPMPQQGFPPPPPFGR